MSSLKELGKRVQREQDEVLATSEDDLHAVRGRLLARPKGSGSRVRAVRAAGILVGVAAVVALGFSVWALRPPPPLVPSRVAVPPVAVAPKLAYRVDGEPNEPGRWLSTGSAETMLVTFTDGSRIGLTAATDLRVTVVRARGASVELSRGLAQVDIRHTAQADWSVRAGPFEVRVVGTAFEVAWDPESAHFELMMKRGRVELRGPVVGTRELRDGRTLQVWLRDGRFEETAPEQRVASSVTEPHAGAPSHAAPPQRRAEDLTAPVSPEPGSRPTAEPGLTDSLGTVDALARAGSYVDAVAAAEGRGWDRTLDELDAPALTRLGDAARFAHRVDRAEEAYAAVRRRFSGAAAATATFELGRVAMDQRRDPGLAAARFETYLREAPDGAFAREALGRLIEARRDAGDAAGARDAAGRYLELFPGGPHAALAASLIGP